MKQKANAWVAISYFILGGVIILGPQAAKAQGVKAFESVDIRFANIRADVCEVANPAVGTVTTSTPDGALIFSAPPTGNCVPVLRTDGIQMTFGEFKAPYGIAKVNCVSSGTVVDVHMSGLQPGGLYTTWVLIDGTAPMGGTALGSIDGDETISNVFRASASGEGQLTRIQPEGAGTITNLKEYIPGCLLDPIPNRVVRLLIVYHFDGTTSGPVAGPATKALGIERILLL